MNRTIFLFFTLIFTSQLAFAWGEKGHHSVGYTAAVISDDYLTPEEKAAIGLAFRARPHQMGHLANMPDISWKDSRRTNVVKFNRPNHYFDAEILVGPMLDKKGQPTLAYSEEYLSKVRNLERDIDKLRQMYDGKPNTLPGAATSENKKTINVYFVSGTNPWRVQDLYNSMVEAFKCAAGKPKLDKKDRKPFISPLKIADNSPVYPYYKCTKNTSRLEDIYAALVFGGVMGHFVGDITQPHHASADYDGWATGQGGLHSYFEDFMVHFLPENLIGEVTTKAKTKREKNWKKFAPPKGTAFWAVQLMLNLTADSLSKMQKLRDIDRKFALLEEGEKITFGGDEGKVKAKRRPYNDPKVLKGYHDFVIEQLSLSSTMLAGIWMEAWREGGRPDLSEWDLITVPYPMDVPFLWPGYSKPYWK
ncbi:MAG: hypothetical protein AABZ31_04315 [Bdellovibrionota bacterium]